MTPIDRLFLFDPKLAHSLKNHQNQLNVSHLRTIVDMTLWSFNIEIELGYSVFSGFEKMVSEKSNDLIDIYGDQIKKYAQKGPSLAILLANTLPLVLLQRKAELTTLFFQTLDTLHDIGLYILHMPLHSFKKVLESGDLNGAMAMLELFSASFSKNLDFHQSKNLTQYLPKICESLNPKKRTFQIKQLVRVAHINVQWIYACDKGLQNGLESLHSQALETFIQRGIDQYSSQPEKGAVYFSISSEIARTVFESLQTVYPLRFIHEKLTKYLHARIGSFVGIQAFSQRPKQYQYVDQSFVHNDSLCIYLPDEIGFFAHKSDNRKLYKYLIRWEASFFEWGTYDFDLEKLIDMYPEIALDEMPQKGSDIFRFIHSFSNEILANNLFILFEHIRIRFCLKRDYPGILRSGIPMFISLIQKDMDNNSSILQQVYNAVVFGIQAETHHRKLYDQIMIAMKSLEHPNARVETSAHLIWKFYADFYALSENHTIKTPLNNNLCLDHIEQTIGKTDKKAATLCKALRQKKIIIYKSEIRKQLYQKGTMSVNDIQKLIEYDADDYTISQCLDSIKEIGHDTHTFSDKEISGAIFHYNEWDDELCSYRINFARVIQAEYIQTYNDCYEKSLCAHSGLLRHIRRRFEMIRPEGLKMLRRWQEGDAFDYRQLLEYGIDRKMRKTPSERIYTKRVKEHRDVAVFLLVDLSRSTANVLPHSSKTVLDVERDAIIIFCEALNQCGDPFAIAGFSSVGRHAVSLYWIKQMNEPLDDTVKNRIGNMSALRNTRMGAAIRHASNLLEQCPSKIRLVIVLSDGFPNDSDYKKDYAIKDTRKAIHEAHSKGIYIHGITVNLSANIRLDDLYGKGNHHVIADISDLPDRLPIIYHQLTKTY